jgi:hypothetical protein
VEKSSSEKLEQNERNKFILAVPLLPKICPLQLGINSSIQLGSNLGITMGMLKAICEYIALSLGKSGQG